MNITNAPHAGAESPYKYVEDFSIIIGPGNTQQTLVLGQSVNFDKCELFYMGYRSDSSIGSPTLEFNGTQNIIATRSTTTGTTVVNGMLKELY
jgi:hypothetical protein